MNNQQHIQQYQIPQKHNRLVILGVVTILVFCIIAGSFIVMSRAKSNEDNGEMNSNIEYCKDNTLYNIIQLNDYISNSENTLNSNDVILDTPENNSYDNYVPSEYCTKFINNSKTSSFVNLDDNMNLDNNNGYFISFWVKKDPLSQVGGSGTLIDSETIRLGLRNGKSELRFIIDKHEQSYVDLEGELLDNTNWNNITINIKGMDKSVAYYINGKKMNISKTSGQTNIGPGKHDFLQNKDNWQKINTLPIDDWWNNKSQEKYNNKLCIGNTTTPSNSYGFNGWIDRIVYGNGQFDDNDIKNIYNKSRVCI